MCWKNMHMSRKIFLFLFHNKNFPLYFIRPYILKILRCAKLKKGSHIRLLLILFIKTEFLQYIWQYIYNVQVSMCILYRQRCILYKSIDINMICMLYKSFKSWVILQSLTSVTLSQAWNIIQEIKKNVSFTAREALSMVLNILNEHF